MYTTDHTVYKIYRNEQYCYEASILTPKSRSATTFIGPETPSAMVAAIEEQYAPCHRLAEHAFQRELEKRIVHTPEMLALLADNWTGQDLRGWHVYGSILRPMRGIKIDNTVYLNGDGARYQQYTIHNYVVSPEPLSEEVCDHYTLVTISHP